MKKREIRSFVRREGKNFKNLMQYWERLWPIYGLEILDLASLEKPLHLEIGFGTGEALYEAAQMEPGLEFLGVEVYQTGVCKVLKLLEEFGPLPNLKVACVDAVELIHALKPNSLLRVQLLFPDPWPKKKHHKRRLIQTSLFDDLMASKLISGGQIRILTDWEDYALDILGLAQGLKVFILLRHQIFSPEQARDCFRTKFAQKGIAAGRSIHEIVFKKI
ncbi:MAG: tRNA (guanosine(46)-N7)-methyltransferase TrmB [Gammaproteobacteria bacterium]